MENCIVCKKPLPEEAVIHGFKVCSEPCSRRRAIEKNRQPKQKIDDPNWVDPAIWKDPVILDAIQKVGKEFVRKCLVQKGDLDQTLENQQQKCQDEMKRYPMSACRLLDECYHMAAIFRLIETGKYGETYRTLKNKGKIQTYKDLKKAGRG